MQYTVWAYFIVANGHGQPIGDARSPLRHGWSIGAQARPARRYGMVDLLAHGRGQLAATAWLISWLTGEASSPLRHGLVIGTLSCLTRAPVRLSTRLTVAASWPRLWAYQPTFWLHRQLCGIDPCGRRSPPPDA